MVVRVLNFFNQMSLVIAKVGAIRSSFVSYDDFDGWMYQDLMTIFLHGIFHQRPHSYISLLQKRLHAIIRMISGLVSLFAAFVSGESGCGVSTREGL